MEPKLHPTTSERWCFFKALRDETGKCSGTTVGSFIPGKIHFYGKRQDKSTANSLLCRARRTGKGGGRTGCTRDASLRLLPQLSPAAPAPAENPAEVVCCRQLPACQGCWGHDSQQQSHCLEGGKMKKSFQLLNIWGLKKPLLTDAETQSFKFHDDLESLKF